MDEESFPRGGVREQTTEPKVKKDKQDKKQGRVVEKNLFGEVEESKDKKKRKKGRKEITKDVSKKTQKQTKDSDVVGKINILTPQILNKKSLYPGMLLLGSVKAIQSYSLTLALPNGLSGVVPIMHISAAYTESLERYSQHHEMGDTVENVSTLSELFHVGMVLPCRLRDYNSAAGDTKKLQLSVNPRDVNGDVQPASLQHGMCIYGSVSSIEDHGYIVDIGVKAVQCFLRHKQAKKFIQQNNHGEGLRVGQIVKCSLLMEGSRVDQQAGRNQVINVSIDPSEVGKHLESSSLAFSALAPGMRVTAKVNKVIQEKGMVLSFHKLKGVVHKSHVPLDLQTYTHRQEVSAVVLAIHPLLKTVHLSLLPHLVDYAGLPTRLFDGVKVSQILAGAVVRHVDKTRGVLLKWEDRLTLFAQLSNLSDNPVDNVIAAFKPGDTHSARVLGFFHMENLVIVTLRKSALDEKYMQATDLKPGELVECTLKSIEKTGLQVQVGSKVKGIIPSIHMADVTLTNPEKKFTVGQKLKCRVLMVNKKRSVVFLTHKKSLLTSKYPVVCDLSEVKVGMELEGFISSIKDFGCFVTFYNNLQGLAPTPLLSTEKIAYPEKVFFPGQIVRCKVVSVDPANSKLKLTFVLEGKKAFGGQDVFTEFNIGQCMKCTITNKNNTGVDVELEGSKKKAFIPRSHLSDFVDLCHALWEKHKVGDVIETAMFWHKTKTPILTCKQSLIVAAKEGQLEKSFSDIEPGMMLPGVVKNVQPYGVFVEFASGLFGLVPNQYGTDKRLPDLSAVYRQGQTVVAKVVEVNADKERFLVSLRMQDCYHGNSEIGLQITAAYLHDRQQLLAIEMKAGGVRGTLASTTLGSVHMATIDQVTDLGVIGHMEVTGVKVVAVKDNVKGMDISVGDTLHCVVLYIDLNKQCLEVAFTSQLVKDVIKRYQAKKHTEQAKVSQTVKSCVLMVKDDYVLVSLKGHCRGQLAYLPARRHWNDVLEKHQYEAGQENSVVIKSVEGGVVLAMLKIHEDRERDEEDKVSHTPTHNLTLGQVCNAKIRKIFPDQVYINIGGTHGRVHRTEMADSTVNGTSPVDSLQMSQEIQVRVIGFRDAKTFKYLPISHPHLRRAMPECTMKPSSLELGTLPENYDCTKTIVNVGDHVVAFVTKVTSQCVHAQLNQHISGKVHTLYLSDDIQVLRSPEQHFKVGRGYNATVIGLENKNKNLATLSFRKKNPVVQQGKATLGVITAINPGTGLNLQLADGIHGTVDLTDILNHYVDNPTASFSLGEIITGFVVEYNIIAKRAVVSLRHSREDFAKPKDPRISSLSDLATGKVLRGYVNKVSNQGLHISVGHGLWGLVTPDCVIGGRDLDNLHEHFSVSQVVTIMVTSVNKDTAKIQLSMLEKNTHVPVVLKSAARKRNISISSDVDLEENEKVKRSRKMSANDDTGKEVQISRKKDKKIQKDQNVSSEPEKSIDSDDIVEKKAAKKEKNKKKNQPKDISEKHSQNVTEEKENSESKVVKVKKGVKVKERGKKRSSKEQTEVEEIKAVSKKKREMFVTEANDKAGDTKKSETKEDDSDSGIEVKVVSASQETMVLDVEDKFSWNSDFKLPVLGKGEISDDESESEAQPQVKKTRDEIRTERIAEEKKLYQYEMQVLEGDRQPETSDDFDRLVLQSPDSSLVWLRYMAFHLESTEIDKARSVAERALKTISFREEQEKLNVWVAYLNLENMYGTAESVRAVLARAVQHNDPVAINMQMVNIYVTSGKTEEAEQLFSSIVKKHSGNKQVWLKFGEFYFTQGRPESARKLMQRALKCLEMRDHVDIITKFAQLEFKLGEPERGKTMFENTLNTYPKRTDLWSIYIDMVTKLGQYEDARSLYKRAVGQPMAVRKMKFFYKKYLQFEEKHGTESHVNDVKQRALEYVEGLQEGS
ncbi:protein RRP5 homolog isoform X2 [Dreissena polymorpha]|uniref:protein RRP5 homolog isoform X2 n=1 Tax=Dreissena polymorpha TaxID=45954 RepID=UPI002264EBEC|nr:protein RRP5 homolog isoform X2 [Dreissena polymorpha]